MIRHHDYKPVFEMYDGSAGSSIPYINNNYVRIPFKLIDVMIRSGNARIKDIIACPICKAHHKMGQRRHTCECTVELEKVKSGIEMKVKRFWVRHNPYSRPRQSYFVCGMETTKDEYETEYALYLLTNS